jgi:hypothetical protein
MENLSATASSTASCFNLVLIKNAMPQHDEQISPTSPTLGHFIKSYTSKKRPELEAIHVTFLRTFLLDLIYNSIVH